MNDTLQVLVLGATGATGRLLTERLLDHGVRVRAIVRSADRLPDSLRRHDLLSVIEANVLALSRSELEEHAAGCDGVASCLGHNLTVKGIFGRPRRLVTDAVMRICQAIRSSRSTRAELTGQPVKLVLMNTAGNSNRDLKESVSVAERGVVGLLRLLVPPHSDNEQAADYLRAEIGQCDNTIEWVVVRPDSLCDEDEASDYQVYPSPIRSAIFNPGRTSRINVAHFMADLFVNDGVWAEWKGQMPVLYNKNPQP